MPALISPRLAVQKRDFLGSGVPYWPLELAIFAAFLKDSGRAARVFDLFGTAPASFEDKGDHYLQGRAFRDLPEKDWTGEDVFIVFALSVMSHGDVLDIVKTIKAKKPGAAVVVLENSQAVTAYDVAALAPEFFAAGADALLCGEPYGNWAGVETYLRERAGAPPANVLVPGKDPTTVQRDYARERAYPNPAWDLFPLENYWALPYSHGPKTEKYLPMLTSRGCPYPCDFCVVPRTNDQRWRARPAAEVVEEMLAMKARWGVRYFQIEDLNPTVNSARWEEISRRLIERRAGVTFGFVSGTKAETVKLDQVPLLAEAGCRYISISPESGSPALMAAIGKPFDHAHGLALVAACRRHGIFTQACFLVGHPAETEADFEASRRYLRALVRAGLDETAIFVVSPVAGSRLYREDKIAMEDRSRLPSFSPEGRAGWRVLRARRAALIRVFFIEKLKKGGDLWRQGLRALFRRPRTKMENLPWRAVYLWTRAARARGAA